MASTINDVLLEVLSRWRVDCVFGRASSPFAPLARTLRQRQRAIRFVQVSDDETAAAVASAYPSFAKRPGVCLIDGAGSREPVPNGLYDAVLNRRPVIAICSERAIEGLREVASYSCVVRDPADAAEALDLACRAAMTRRSVTCIALPPEIQEAVADPLRRPLPPIEGSGGDLEDGIGDEGRPTGPDDPVRLESDRLLAAMTAALPADATTDAAPAGDASAEAASVGAIRIAAERLNGTSRIAVVAGRGASGATLELEELAAVLAAPVVKTLLGKAAIPDDSAYVAGGVGKFGSRVAREVLASAEAVLMIGTSLPYRDLHPARGAAAYTIQIDRDPNRLGTRYPVDLGIAGDAAEVIRGLLAHLRPNPDRAFLQSAQSAVALHRLALGERAGRSDWPADAEVLAWRIGRALPRSAVVAIDAGPVATTWARFLPMQRGQILSIATNYVSTSSCLPYAVAAQVAYPERPCLAFVGPTGAPILLREFAVCSRNGLPVKFFLIRGSTPDFAGDPGVCMQGSVPDVDLGLFARSCGGAGYSIDRAERVEEVIRQAIAFPGPVIVEVDAAAERRRSPPAEDPAAQLLE